METRVEESYESHGNRMGKLKDEARHIQMETKIVDDLISQKIHYLQSTSDDIESMAIRWRIGCICWMFRHS